MKTPRSFSFISILIPAAVFLLSGSAMAVPAAPDPIIVTQPDGTTVEAYNKGDERQNWMETEKGHTIARDAKTKKWYYVDHYIDNVPVLSTVPAHQNAPIKLKKHLRPQKSKAAKQQSENADESESSDSAEPSSGSSSAQALAGSTENGPASGSGEPMTGKVLFILIEFAGETPANPTMPAREHFYPASDWADFLSDNIADFFNSASYGRANLGPAQETDGAVDDGVIGWVTLNRGHPGAAKSPGDEDWTNSDESRELATAAVKAADPYIDFAAYDVNNDGYVDSNELAVNIVVAGYENSIGGDAYLPTIWGHKFSLSTPVTTDDQNTAGTKVRVGDYHNKAGGYAIFGEVHQSAPSNRHQATMGIMVHELGHLIFGFPDLYDTDSSSSGIGAFCVMSGGSWGRATGDQWSGQTPVLPSAWIKHYAGWVTPVASCGGHTLTAAGDGTANALNTVSRVITPDYPDQYFLVENRQPVGYDRGLQRYLGSSFGGLAIFHIDDTQLNNTIDAHRKVDLEEADGIQMGTSSGTAAKLWFNGQAANANGFSAGSTPNSNLYPSGTSGVSVSDISNSGTVMNATMTADQDYCYPDSILLYEDFDGATPHQGWTVVDNEGYGKKWQFASPWTPPQENYTGGSGNYAVADSWYYYSRNIQTGDRSGTMDTELRSPFFSRSAYRELHLSFSSYLDHYDANDSATVDIRCSDESWEWRELWNRTGTDIVHRESPVIDISQPASASEESTCQIRFHYFRTLAFKWQIDTITVSGVLSQPGFEGSSYALPANQWRLISLPREPENDATVSNLFGDDLQTAEYDSSWILFNRNTTTDEYDQLSLNSILDLGNGYWIYSYTAASLDIPGYPATPQYSAECPSGCFEIPLSKAGSEAASFRNNLAGNPFSRNVKWNDVRFKVQDGTGSMIYSPAEAMAAGYVSNTGYTYSGSAWQAFDDATLGMEGILQEFDGLLVKVLGGPIVDTYDTVSLLIPAADQTAATPQDTLLKAVANPDMNVNAGWYVRLTAEDPANDLTDKGNVLGLLPDSTYGYDQHDLAEPEPMSGNFLTVIFPHPGWGEKAGDYTSDFRRLRPRDVYVNRVIKWHFEVRTNDPQRKVTLSWSSLPPILKRSVLIDEQTGKIIKTNTVNSYTFLMNGTTRGFTWRTR